MKKNILEKATLIFLSASFILTSCVDNEPVLKKIPESTVTTLKGVVSETKTLDPNRIYVISEPFTVESGGELIIPAGTKIIASKYGQDVFINVLQGGKIDVQGTSDKPVIMRSMSGKPGEWGGLNIYGKAITTAGDSAKDGVTSKSEGFEYGGTDISDSSGSIKYLIIEGAGSKIGNTKYSYNGLSLYAVGSGTKMENIAIINGADDGIEFFGGSVEVTNLYLENNADDSVDWMEGWSGSIENAYISNTKEFSHAIEGGGDNGNPRLKNVTAISTIGGTGIRLQGQAGVTIEGLSIVDYDKNIDVIDEDNDPTKNGDFSNLQIDGITATSEGEYQTSKLDISTWEWYKAKLK